MITSLGNIIAQAEDREIIFSKTSYNPYNVENLELGTRTSDFITDYGAIIKSPKTNGDSDKMVLEIPK